MCLCAYVKKTYVPMSKIFCAYVQKYVLMSEGYLAPSA